MIRYRGFDGSGADFTGIYNIFNEIPEQGEDSYEYSIKSERIYEYMIDDYKWKRARGKSEGGKMKEFRIVRMGEHISMVRENPDGTKTPLTLPCRTMRG